MGVILRISPDYYKKYAYITQKSKENPDKDFLVRGSIQEKLYAFVAK